MEETIYVLLLNEGVDVWKPVQAQKISASSYIIVTVNTDPDEEWEFETGQIVSVKEVQKDSGIIKVAYKS